MLTIETAKAYAEKITEGRATYARHGMVDGNHPFISVRVRMPDYRVYWVDCWLESGRVYGEY